MRCLSLRYVALLSAVLPASAATIKVEPPERDGPAVVTTEGDMECGNEKNFIEQALKLESAVLLLSSRGGNLDVGFREDERFGSRAVRPTCPTAFIARPRVRVAWLVCVPPAMSATAHMRFRAGYRMGGSPKTDAVANAMLGARLNGLGLPEGFLICATRTPPERVAAVRRRAKGSNLGEGGQAMVARRNQSRRWG